MARAIKFLAVCGNGLGSSLIVKMALEGVLADEGVNGIIECTSVAQAAGMMPFSDVILVGRGFYNGIKHSVPEDKELIVCDNLLDKNELTEKVLEYVKNNK